MQNIKIGYRVLMVLTKRSFQQLVRSAVGLFKEDPKAPKSGGKARAFTLNEAWWIYLVGIFIDDLKMKIDDANNLILHLMNEMSYFRTSPGTDPINLLPENQWAMSEPLKRIVLLVYPNRVYEVRIYDRRISDMIEQEERLTLEVIERFNWLRGDEGPYYSRVFPEYNFGEENGNPLKIELTGHLEYFIDELKALGFRVE